MRQLNLFIELTRLKKPIGFMLLFWPCAWGLTLAYDFSFSLNNYFFYLILFFLGSVFMRSAGCIVNDVLDKKYDAKVNPHAHGQNRSIKPIGFFNLVCSINKFNCLIIYL